MDSHRLLAPSGSPKRAPSLRWAPAATRSTTRWPRRSSGCTRPSWSAGAALEGIDEVEYATLEWVDWFNHRRLLEPIGNIPPAELEAAHHRREAPSSIDGLKQPSLR
jgi:transposase InsO family protein